MKKNPSSTNLKKYREISNVVRSKTRHDTKQKAVMLSQNSSSHRKHFWAWVNSVKRNQSPLPPIVGKSGETVSDDSARADLFN